MQAESTTNERDIKPRGKNTPPCNYAPMLQAMKQAHSQCYIPRKHAQINRQPRRLEFTLSHTKQTAAPQINRQQITTSKITHSSISNRHNQNAAQAPARHSALATHHCLSNRHTPRLENAISPRKQTLGASSNRHFLHVSARRQRQTANAHRTPHNISNRQWQILENNVNHSKQTTAPRSNRHKNAIFSSTKSRATTPRRQSLLTSHRSPPFAHPSNQCENTHMQKTLNKTACALTFVLAAVLTLAGTDSAQDTTPSNSQQTPSTTPSAAKSSSTSTSKTQSTTKTGTATHHTPAKTAAPLVLTTDKQKASYAIGMNIGSSIRRQSVDVDPDILARGLKDSLAGGKTLLTDDEAKAALTALQAEARKAQEEKMQAASAANKKEGDAFLAENKTKPGVVTLPSGLQYKVITEGTGPKPTADESVVCNYRGTLLNGTEFDSSYKHGQPIEIPVGRVIKGWSEALQLMPVGSKWQLFIPPDLAYGERGAGNDIGPNATIVFEVDLLSIKPQVKPGVAPIPSTPSTPQD
jgi:FKBP-type peptidyl-prolyl cis-trans isomerase FklB